jgi:hypothetical protein
MIEKSSINFDLFFYLLSYSRCNHIKHFYILIDRNYYDSNKTLKHFHIYQFIKEHTLSS